MNRHFTFNIIVLTCLCVIVSKSYGWTQPPVAVISGPDRQYGGAGTQRDFNGANSYDPDGGSITAWFWYIDGGDATPSSWYSEGSPSMTTTFRTGGHYAYVYLSVRDDEGVWSTTDVCYVHIVDLDADADRNGNITFADEDGENTWAKGTNAKGAIVLPNCDDDGADGAPDNWTGDLNPPEYYDENFAVWDWDLDGIRDDPSEYPNYKVDNDADIADLAELWFHQMLFRVGHWFRITLEVTKVGTHSFYSSLQDKDIVRIFLPNQQQNGNWVVGAGAEAIIGPEKGNTAEFTGPPPDTPNGNGLLSMFQGDGIVKFCVEGIEFGAMVDITLKFYENGVEQASDKVRMRVAPFVMADHKMNVSLPAGDAKTAYVSKWIPEDGPENKDVREKLRQQYNYPPDYQIGHLDEVRDGPQQGDLLYRNDIWHQDPAEIGYVKAPYGSMPVFLVLPRAKRVKGLPYPINKDLLKYIHRKRLEPNVGVCWRLEGIEIETPSQEEMYNAGGNIESVPVASGPGKLLYGTEFQQTIDDFFKAQGVNPFLKVNTSWLDVGHVDEIVSFAPDGLHTIVADPEVCWALLIWVKSLNLYPLPTILGQSVNDILDNGNLRNFNLETQGENPLVMVTENLPSVRADLNLASPVTITPDSYSENGHLTKAGAFIGFFGSNPRKYCIVFGENWNEYAVWYSDNGTDWTVDNNAYYPNKAFPLNWVAYANCDCIFKDAKCFILKDWLQDSFQKDDYFTFEANPSCTTIEMPVLFEKKLSGRAGAKTINHVNCLVDGGRVFTGMTHELPDSPPGTLTTYVRSLFEKAGFATSSIIEADSSTLYHPSGDIHCGTNVQRVIPISYKWWEYGQ